MKKSDLKRLKKAIKENIKANVVIALTQTSSELGSVPANFEKKVLKESEKLAKKIAKLIRPTEPVEKITEVVAPNKAKALPVKKAKKITEAAAV